MSDEQNPKKITRAFVLAAGLGKRMRPITATLVRQIAGMGGDVSPFVPAAVAARLRQRFAAHS